ncbi:MAG TPA: YebC/PmpR family DNA-binding transcriptional regulator, partial [Candidatus Eremiobacteraceae bacterium]|nr:YebC/PmpR family DNA-binding transcriptional regulator [Candidatus Eremiobacteraceae bacterium]
SDEDLLEVADVDGVVDVRVEGDAAEILTDPRALGAAREKVERDVLAPRGKAVDSATVELVAKTKVDVSPADAASVLKLLDALEEHEDVTNVYSNADIPDAVLETLA